MSVGTFDSTGSRELGAGDSQLRLRNLMTLFPPRQQNIRHCMVYLGGHVGRHPQGGGMLYRTEEDGRTPRADATASDQIKTCFPQLRSGLVVWAVDGSGGDQTRNNVVGEAAGWIRDNFDPRGALIIYGYSVGGHNALCLCKHIESHYDWYNFDGPRLGHLPNPRDADRSHCGKVRVDLLISVDPCAVNFSPHPTHRTRFGPPPALVQKHVNYYQRASASGKYMGQKTNQRGVDQQITVGSMPVNHDNMPRLAVQSVCSEIGALLSLLQ
jgi:hypothetical protein